MNDELSLKDILNDMDKLKNNEKAMFNATVKKEHSIPDIASNIITTWDDRKFFVIPVGNYFIYVDKDSIIYNSNVDVDKIKTIWEVTERKAYSIRKLFDLNCIDENIIYKKPIKKMTKEEIEKALGYKIEIIE